MRRNWRWIAGAAGLLLAVALIVGVVRVYSETPTPVATPVEESVETPAEQAEPVKSEPYVGSVQTVGTSGGLLVAHVNSPGAGSLHWENSQGLVSSDTITWEQPLVGDVELSPIGGTTGLRPVLIPEGGEPIKGNPIP